MTKNDMRLDAARFAIVCILASLLVATVLTGCEPETSATPARGTTTIDAAAVPPTATFEPTQTPLPTPTPTPEVTVTVDLPPTRDPNATPVPDPDVDEGRLVRLTRTWDSERDPAWSPVGDKIAFECYDDGWLTHSGKVRNWPIHYYYFRGDICVMNADGSGREQLTDGEGDAHDPTWSPDGKKIAFSSIRDGQRDIYVMNADGSGLRRVTNDEPDDTGPTWSPDGTKIAFSSRREGNTDIYVVNVDGSGLKRITFDEAQETEPAWSPDGTRIAFTRHKYVSTIYLMNSDGSAWRFVDGFPGNARSPAWSPDGKSLAIMAEPPGIFLDKPYEIYTINIDEAGARVTRRTDRLSTDANPAWSPDGSMLVFTSNLVRNTEIYVISELPDLPKHYLQLTDSPAVNPTIRKHYLRLTDGTSGNYEPAWSPDGSQIVFVSDRDGNAELYVMNADGSEARRLTNNDRSDHNPAWSPDGTKIAFTSYGNWQRDIFVINSDGSGMSNLTNFPASSRQLNELGMGPAWSPDGEQIAFMSLHGARFVIDIVNPDGTEQARLDSRICPDLRVAFDGVGVWNWPLTRHPSLSWSPDGSKIAFTCGDSYLYLVDPLGENQTSIRACDHAIASLSWSPDSQHVAFYCGSTETSYALYMINIVDGEVTRITDHTRGNHQPTDYIQPSWSPDGTKIAFSSKQYGVYDIYVLELEP